jgi:hypothetical protein
MIHYLYPSACVDVDHVYKIYDENTYTLKYTSMYTVASIGVKEALLYSILYSN